MCPDVAEMCPDVADMCPDIPDMCPGVPDMNNIQKENTNIICFHRKKYTFVVLKK
jgi:hypothetical protein